MGLGTVFIQKLLVNFTNYRIQFRRGTFMWLIVNCMAIQMIDMHGITKWVLFCLSQHMTHFQYFKGAK